MRKRYIALLLSIAIGWTSCDDFFERDLSGETVTLLAPSNGVITDLSVQTFWWDEVEGALGYELQVVTTTFDSIVQLVLDTTVGGTQFQQTLWPGQFQWRVRAVNASSMSAFSTFTLYVDTASDLLGQTIVLESPASGVYLNSLTQGFAWQGLTLAQHYRFQLSDDGFSSGANVLDTVVSSVNLNYTFPTDQHFYWRVRAETETSVSSYSSIWNLIIDTTPPDSVTLWLPANNAIFQSQAFDFAWQPITDSGSPLIDSLYLYSDSLITLYSAYEGVQSSVTDSVAAGSYFWRVRTFDEAGNSGAYSTTRKFTVF